MSRNYKRKRYHPTPIERGSELEREFLADLTAHQATDRPGPFIAERLAEYYKAKREGRLLPEGSTPSFVAGTVHMNRPASIPPVDRAAEGSVTQPESAVAVADPPAVEATITAAKGGGNFDFFFDDDDDE
jgi:hypothetical protein